MFNRGLISDQFDLLIFPSTNVEIEKSDIFVKTSNGGEEEEIFHTFSFFLF